MWTSDRHELIVNQSIICNLRGCQCIKNSKVENLLVATSWLELTQKKRKEKWVYTTPMLPLAWSMVFLHLQVGFILCITYPQKNWALWEEEEGAWRNVKKSELFKLHNCEQATPHMSPPRHIWEQVLWFLLGWKNTSSSLEQHGPSGMKWLGEFSILPLIQLKHGTLNIGTSVTYYLELPDVISSY